MSTQVGTNTVQNYLYKLVPSASLTTGAYATLIASGNIKFNTNIPFGMAMLIRRIRSKFINSDGGNLLSAPDFYTLVMELTENLGLLTPEATDPLALWTEIATIGTPGAATGFYEDHEGFITIDYLPSHPGVPTIAQQLNLVLSNIRQGSGTAKFNGFMEIFYELIVVTPALQAYLANRIALQRVT
jgi:hypothetical protein